MKVETILSMAQVLIFSAALGLCTFMAFRPEPVPEVQKWEYIVGTIADSDWETTGKEMGLAGWDLVMCRRAQGEDESFSYECILKRPIVTP